MEKEIDKAEASAPSVYNPVATFQPIPGVPDLYHARIPLPQPKQTSGTTPNATALKRASSHFAIIFILDRSGSMSGTFRPLLLPACAELLDQTKPDESIAVMFDSSTVVEPNATSEWFRTTPINISGSTRIDSGVEEAVNQAIKHQANHPGQKWTYQFILMTDGGNDFSGDKLKTTIMQNKEKVVTANLDCIVSILNIGVGADTQAGMWSREAVQTISVESQSALLQAAATTDLPNVVAALALETSAIRTGRTGTIGVVLKSGQDAASTSSSTTPTVATQGFLVDVTIPPMIGFSSRIGKDEDSLLLMYKGNPENIDHLTLDVGEEESEGVPQIITLKTEIIPKVIEYNQVFSLCEKMAQQLRIKQVTRAPGVDIGLNLLQSIINVVETSAVEQLSQARGARDRLRLMRKGLSPLKSIMNALNRSQDISKASSADMASYIRGADTMKYGYQALNRATGATATDIVQDLLSVVNAQNPASTAPAGAAATAATPVADGDALPTQPTPAPVPTATATATSAIAAASTENRPKSFISHLNAEELMTQWNDLPSLLTEVGGTMNEHELLYAFGMLGYGIRVIRSSASDVEPWQLQVIYLSVDRISTTDVICLLDSGTSSVKDTAGQDISDTIVVVDPSDPHPYSTFVKTKLHEAFLGVLFARNPSIAIPAQATALVSLTLVRGISQMKHAKHRTKAHVRTVLEILLQLNSRIAYSTSNYWKDMITKLHDAEPGMYLTTREGDDISTIAKVLAAMCSLESAADLFDKNADPKRLKKLVHDVLAQTISNSMRIKLRSQTHETALTILKDAFQIKRETVPYPLADDIEEPPEPELTFIDDYDKASTYAKATNLISLKWGNCSIGDVATCFRFARILYGTVIPSLKEDYESEDAESDSKSALTILRRIMRAANKPGSLEEKKLIDIMKMIQDGFEGIDATVEGMMKEYGLPIVGEREEIDDPAEVPKTYVSAVVLQSLQNTESTYRKGVLEYVPVNTVDTPQVAGKGKGSGDPDDDGDKKKEEEKKEEEEKKKEEVKDKGKEKVDESKPEEGAGSSTAADSSSAEGVAAKKSMRPQLEDLSQYARCVDYLRKSAVDARKQIYRSDCEAKNSKFAKIKATRLAKERLEHELRAIAEFSLTHFGNPTFFVQADVDAHNAANPGNKFTLAEGPDGEQTGMLTQHCCYPMCAQYLLYNPYLTRHFKLFGSSYPVGDSRRTWSKGWHWNCVKLWKKDRTITKEDFAKRIMEMYNLAPKPQKEQELYEIWETLKIKGV